MVVKEVVSLGFLCWNNVPRVFPDDDSRVFNFGCLFDDRVVGLKRDSTIGAQELLDCLFAFRVLSASLAPETPAFLAYHGHAVLESVGLALCDLECVCESYR